MLLCVACTSTRRTGTEYSILEYQRQIDRLESELRSRDTAIANTVRELESITGRSESVGSTVDDAIRELDSYQQTVERVIRGLAATETESKATSESAHLSD